MHYRSRGELGSETAPANDNTSGYVPPSYGGT